MASISETRLALRKKVRSLISSACRFFRRAFMSTCCCVTSSCDDVCEITRPSCAMSLSAAASFSEGMRSVIVAPPGLGRHVLFGGAVERLGNRHRLASGVHRQVRDRGAVLGGESADGGDALVEILHLDLYARRADDERVHRGAFGCLGRVNRGSGNRVPFGRRRVGLHSLLRSHRRHSTRPTRRRSPVQRSVPPHPTANDAAKSRVMPSHRMPS